MPSVPLAGDPVAPDGRLPDSALEAVGRRPFGFYVHVPFCSVRCGYCDFNTYTSEELGDGASRATYAETVLGEIRLARRVLGERELPVETIFFGGGTPTLLPARDLVAIVDGIRSEFGLAAGPEITVESNPDSVEAADLAVLRAGGIDRISFGMQSAVRHVLQVLDRTHDPRRVPDVVRWAREAGFEKISLDLIYGTPTESMDDWAATVEAALECEPDHVSAYSLIVEQGTALARRVRRGEIDAPEDDDHADKYEWVDARLRAAGLEWYEVSNWSRTPEQRCRHNLGYWTGADWWGAGPGAHSHVGGVRWWNVKHPTAYAGRLAQQQSPGLAREVLDAPTQYLERVMLELRLRDGIALDVLDEEGRAGVPGLVAEGRVRVDGDRLRLTDSGRLLADGVVRDLLV